MRALVTGAGGFAGQWLCKELIADGWDIHGATLTGAPALGILHDWQRDAVMWHDVDLRDRGETARIVEETNPDAVFHLAAVSYLPDAGADPGNAWATNVLSTVGLLDAIAEQRAAGSIDPVIVIAGSAEQYGAHPPADMPLLETASQDPVTTYGATKVAQEAAALAYWRAHGLRVIPTRPFNHSGPGQVASFLLPALVERAREADRKKARSLKIGNPDSVRDFLYVRDVARAYIFLALRGVPGEAYNIASGEGVSVARLAELVLEQVGCNAKVEVDPALVRPVDIPVLIGDPTKLTTTTTWTPHYTLDMLIDEVIYGEAD